MWIHAIFVPCAGVAAFLVDVHGAQRVVLVTCWLLIAVLYATNAWHLAGIRRRARRYLPEATGQ